MSIDTGPIREILVMRLSNILRDELDLTYLTQGSGAATPWTEVEYDLRRDALVVRVLVRDRDLVVPYASIEETHLVGVQGVLVAGDEEQRVLDVEYAFRQRVRAGLATLAKQQSRSFVVGMDPGFEKSVTTLVAHDPGRKGFVFDSFVLKDQDPAEVDPEVARDFVAAVVKTVQHQQETLLRQDMKPEPMTPSELKDFVESRYDAVTFRREIMGIPMPEDTKMRVPEGIRAQVAEMFSRSPPILMHSLPEHGMSSPAMLAAAALAAEPHRFMRCGVYGDLEDHPVRFEMRLQDGQPEPEPFTLARWLGPGRLMFLGPWAADLRALPRPWGPYEAWTASWDGTWTLRAWDPELDGIGGSHLIEPDHVMYAVLFGYSGRPGARHGLDDALVMALFDRLTFGAGGHKPLGMRDAERPTR
jgi:hypothetical protein